MTLKELFDRFAQLNHLGEGGVREKLGLIRRYPAIASLSFEDVLKKGFGSWGADVIEALVLRALDEDARNAAETQERIAALLSRGAKKQEPPQTGGHAPVQ